MPETVPTGKTHLQIVDDGLSATGRIIPSEFSRRYRSLSAIDLWNASEFRPFLLYLDVVVLNGLITYGIIDMF